MDASSSFDELQAFQSVTVIHPRYSAEETRQVAGLLQAVAAHLPDEWRPVAATVAERLRACARDGDPGQDVVEQVLDLLREHPGWPAFASGAGGAGRHATRDVVRYLVGGEVDYAALRLAGLVGYRATVVALLRDGYRLDADLCDLIADIRSVDSAVGWAALAFSRHVQGRPAAWAQRFVMASIADDRFGGKAVDALAAVGHLEFSPPQAEVAATLILDGIPADTIAAAVEALA